MSLVILAASFFRYRAENKQTHSKTEVKTLHLLPLVWVTNWNNG